MFETVRLHTMSGDSATFGKEKGRSLDFNERPWKGIWWSWGDLNPRPQAIFEQIYMFSGLI